VVNEARSTRAASAAVAAGRCFGAGAVDTAAEHGGGGCVVVVIEAAGVVVIEAVTARGDRGDRGNRWYRSGSSS